MSRRSMHAAVSGVPPPRTRFGPFCPRGEATPPTARQRRRSDPLSSGGVRPSGAPARAPFAHLSNHEANALSVPRPAERREENLRLGDATPMVAILVFALALFLAALISELAHRSIVSTTVLFLIVGLFAGPGFLDLISLSPKSGVLSRVAEFAMCTVLFTDGMELGARDLSRSWRLPTLALGVGLPLTVLGTAALAHYVVGAPWVLALLVGAILAPTDPVFASAIVGRREIPDRLRNLLNIESGLNDGLALPLVLALVAITTGAPADGWRMTADVILGVALGIGVPWLGHRIEQLRAFTVSAKYEPLFALALGLVIYATASLTGVNMFLAAFAAGVSIASIQPRFSKTFCEFGELVSELLKLATVMLFGTLLTPRFFSEVPVSGFVFAVLALVLVRPIALEISFLGSTLSRYERAAAYWFGPKGFASIVYGIFMLRSGVAHGDELFRLVALVVALSIIAHSSTDVIVARWFKPRGSLSAAEPHRGDAGRPAK